MTRALHAVAWLLAWPVLAVLAVLDDAVIRYDADALDDWAQR